MADSKPTAQVRNGLTSFFFYLLLFSYPILGLLWRRSYPVFTAEVLLIFLVVIGMSIIFGLITTRLRPSVSYLLKGILILVTAMVQFNLLIEGLVLSIGVIALLIFVLRQRFLSFCLPVLLALIIGAYLDSRTESIIDQAAKNPELVATDLAPIIHIMLDGFTGIGGLPQYPASELIRQEILSFMDINGFQVYSNAYSRYVTTVDSMYSLLNYQNDGGSIFGLEAAGRRDHVVKKNAVFTAVEELGYRLNVYQTGHLDMCQSNPANLDRCWQYDHPNIRSLITINNTKFKFRVIATVLLNQSKLLSDLLFTEERSLGNLAVANHDPQVFRELGQDIRTKGRGNYFFAHALIPHGPFTYQPDCSVSYEPPDYLRVASQFDEVEWPAQVYEIRNGLYFGQIECALRSLQSLLDSIKSTGLYDRALFILHGDHGSTISPLHPVVSNIRTLTAQDYRAYYSTLFAVKYPGSVFKVDERVLPISYLLEEFIRALPSYVTRADHYAVFRPSGEADSEKIGSYIYLRSGFPLHRVDIKFFND